MSILSSDRNVAVFGDYYKEYGLRVEEVSPEGAVLGEPEFSALRNSHQICRIRVEALQEAMRWGEAGTFFLAPGIISWIVPVFDDGGLCGGLLGGEVLPESIDFERSAAFYSLKQSGCSSADIDGYLDHLSAFPQARIREAGDFLRGSLCAMSGSSESALNKQREDAQQQREIAQFIQEKKGARSSMYSLGQERILLSLISVGDKNAARGVLNDMLASTFLYSPKLMLIKSRMIEMMGYLVRSAIEENPALERLLDYQQNWLNSIIEADEFDDLCNVVRRSLDDFIDQVFLQRFSRSNASVTAVLEYLSGNYRRKVTLDEVAEHVGLSKYRVAHLVKDVTGQSIFQHIKRMRVEKAQELLAASSLDYADITYELGFTDQSAFIKQFRELTGTTPGRYRKHCIS